MKDANNSVISFSTYKNNQEMLKKYSFSKITNPYLQRKEKIKNKKEKEIVECLEEARYNIENILDIKQYQEDEDILNLYDKILSAQKNVVKVLNLKDLEASTKLKYDKVCIQLHKLRTYAFEFYEGSQGDGTDIDKKFREIYNKMINRAYCLFYPIRDKVNEDYNNQI